MVSCWGNKNKERATQRELDLLQTRDEKKFPQGRENLYEGLQATQIDTKHTLYRWKGAKALGGEEIGNIIIRTAVTAKGLEKKGGGS